MTIHEFSNGFDILAQSYLLEGGFTVSDSSLYAFNEYEKSLYLTQTQEQYVVSLYNGKNASGDRFEATEEARRYLHNLVAEYYTDEPIGKSDAKNYLGVSYQTMAAHGSPFKSTLFSLPPDLWFITYESVQTVPDETRGDCDGRYGISQDVIPVTQDEFHRIKRNPFRGPSYRRALRLDLSDSSAGSNGVVEIISKYDIGSYYARYIKRLEPIILVDLPDGLEINGRNTVTECVLHDAIHRTILEYAVKLAIADRTQYNRNGKSDKGSD